ncbi:MAG: hypothetical protein ACYDC5_07565 [Candidatus Dormibacteria bacterium]
MAASLFLHEWMDDLAIETVEDARRALAPTGAGIKRLKQLAASAMTQPMPQRNKPGFGVLAGRGLDLSGELDCLDPKCQQEQIGLLFARVLHYFDQVIVAGPQAYTYIRGLRSPDSSFVDRTVVTHVGTLLTIRALGATEIVEFVQKPPPCRIHYSDIAAASGLAAILDGRQDGIAALTATGKVRSLRPVRDHWDYIFDNLDILTHTEWGSVQRPQIGIPKSTDIAGAIVDNHLAHLVSDLACARQLQVPLGTRIPLHQILVARLGGGVSADQAALELHLPVLDGVPFEEIIRIREQYRGEFERFRTALRFALTARLAASGDMAEATRAIELDVVAPALREISDKLEMAARTLRRKTAATASLAVLPTIVGAFAGLPALFDVGVAGMLAGFIHALHSRLDRKADVELSDMYFLWRFAEDGHN